MDGFECNGIGGVIAWVCAIAIIWVGLGLPAPKVGKVAKSVVLAVFSYVIFFYVMRK